MRPDIREIRKPLFARIFSDPLLHFMAIGAAIFLLTDTFGPSTENSNELIVSDSVYADLVTIFAETNERPPTVEEMSDLLDRWVLNEALYREASALGLEQGDEMIRERIMQKMRVLIQSAVLVPKAEEQELRAWFEENRSVYDVPPRLTFQLARLDAEETQARDAAELMNAGGEAGQEILREIYTFRNRARPALVQLFDAEMVARLEGLPIGAWHAVDTVNGWQLVKLMELKPAESADFDTLRPRIVVDHRNDAFRKASTDAVEALIARYDVKIVPYDPDDYAEVVQAVAQRGGRTP